MVIAHYPTKTALKAVARVIDKSTKAVIKEGQHLLYTDPAIVGPGDYKHTGTFAVVGPSAENRKWYATVTLENGIVVKVV